MQFGRALERILQRLVQADPRYGPTYLIKVDIADGFYRVHLQPQDIPSLAVAFPPAPDGTQLVALPLVLPMGWVLSPPYFSAATETAADMANNLLHTRYQPPPHRLDQAADAAGTCDPEPPSCGPTTATLPAVSSTRLPPRPRYLHPRRKRLQYVDIYVDDYIGAVQGGPALRTRARRILFETIDQVFRPQSASDPPTRQEPISVKKLHKGDARWATRKVILGWLLDTVAETLEPPIV
jgi:hypothetical protein